MKNRFRKQNFTLQEMLVVITIIVILCMLLLPAINSVREIAKRSTCLSRVREVSQLQAKYAAQNDGQQKSSRQNGLQCPDHGKSDS